MIHLKKKESSCSKFRVKHSLTIISQRILFYLIASAIKINYHKLRKEEGTHKTKKKKK